MIAIGIISVLIFSPQPHDDLFEKSQNIEAVKVFLEKYPNPEVVTEINHILSIRYVYETTSNDFLLHPYVLIKLTEDGTTEQITLECWDGKEKHIVQGDDNVVGYLQKGTCLDDIK